MIYTIKIVIMKYIKLFEYFGALRHRPAEFIKQLRSDFKREYNIVSSLDINSGLCIEFSEALVDMFDRDYNGNCPHVDILHSDWFAQSVDEYDGSYESELKTQHLVWDKAALKMYGGILPIDLNVIEEITHHQWIIYKGKHYDAETPNGVDRWFQLPIFKRMIAKSKKQKATI
jgi:hypothetical protein